MRVAGDAQTNASRDIDPTTNRLPLVLRIWATWRGALVALVIGLVVQLIDVTVLNIPSLVSLLLMVAVFAIFHWRGLTERRNAQEALKASEERYRDLLRDMSERMRTEQTLRNASLTDPLTGLYNRRGALTLAEQQLKTALRHGRAMMVMYADLNHLKQINDTCGHAAGDEALMETARLLQETFRDSDIIARMGGDEFVILAMESSHNSEATLRGRLAGKLDVHNLGRHCGFPLSISLGVAHFDPAHPCSLEELLTAADQRMYADKRRSATRYARSVMRGA